ncbi:MAG: UDP-N-acetylmuramoyl-tripeptide--D-alanyl-D-alanine ligase [Deltaproteobacteria bacterium]|nr:UDP-N-acetylmuramoyl-tripeptide--D-alanyl-D-alanine ligase [Deltaproteobacteria bacterium]
MATPIPKNRAAFSLAELLSITHGTLDPRAVTPPEGVVGVCTDSRAVGPGELFVALEGEAMDGATFAAAAAQRGAAVILAHRPITQDCGAAVVITVADTLVALGALGAAHCARIRAAAAIPVLAIGGAAGKTTTKELAASVSRALFGRTLATKGNLNNLIGVPMTLFELTHEDRAAVIETGTNQLGEIPRLAAMVRPDVALVLNVDIEHTEGLQSLELVADEEGALFAGCTRAAVGNRDEPLSYGQMGRIAPGVRAWSFGESDTSDARLISRSTTAQGQSRLEIRLSAELVRRDFPVNLQCTIALLGPGPAIDAVAALAACVAMMHHAPSDEELQRAIDALGEVRAVSGRLHPTVTKADVMVLDDSYNANPCSVRSSLVAAKELADARGGDLHVALGDMLELGDHTEAQHAAVVAQLSAQWPATVVAMGPAFARALAGVAVPEGALTLGDDPAVLVAALRARLSPRDVVVVKGSRGLRMERIAQALCGPL